MPEYKPIFNTKSFNRRLDAGIPLYVKGVKRTRTRVAVYTLFQRTFSPISAEDILEKTNGIDRATIYRILKTFEKNKLIEKADKKDKQRRTLYQIM